MRTADLDRERCEKTRSLGEFMTLYNEDLPSAFPRASVVLLQEFRSSYPTFFKPGGGWSLDLHRKRVMDWLPSKVAAADRLSKSS
ncbi:MAG TPA: hypothetical protein VFY28_01355 [Candidatus Paceibacterota bacterium]|nr:hypothetical protein [Candidatus Paceibacterota bacterium]